MSDQDKKPRVSAPPNAAGHRQRLRERFCRAGLNGLQDYEAVELLLSYAIPRRDVKPLAKDLLRDFGSLEGLMDAPMHKLIDEHGMGVNSALLIRLIREMCSCYLEQRARKADVLNSFERVEEFVRMKLGGCQNETLMTIFLNSHNRIIDYELTPGTVNHASVYVRELAKRAVLANATGVILAHNHPSGVCLPSHEDIKLTGSIRNALATFGVKLFCHMVVTPSECRRICASPCEEPPKISRHDNY